MNDPQNPCCCSDQNLCCGTPVPGPPRRKIWKTILFLLILLVGMAVAALYWLLAKG